MQVLKKINFQLVLLVILDFVVSDIPRDNKELDKLTTRRFSEQTTTQSDGLLNDEDLFTSTCDNQNLTTEKWEVDIQDLLNTSVEDIFNVTDDKNVALNSTSGISLDTIIRIWLEDLEQKQRNQTDDVEAVINLTTTGISFAFVQTPTTILGTQTSTGDPSIVTDGIDTPPVTDFPNLVSEKWTTVEKKTSITLQSTTMSTLLTEPPQVSSADTLTDEDITVDDESQISNIFGRLQNEDGITCVSLNCTIQIFVNGTPINIPQNLSVLESSRGEQGSMTFQWFDNNKNSVSIVFDIQSKGEDYYIDSCAVRITNAAAFQEDLSDDELNVIKDNLELLKTRIGTTLKVDRGLVLPIGNVVAVYLFKIRFSALRKLSTTGRLSSAFSFSEYCIEILSLLLGLSILSIVLVFICKRYLPRFVYKMS